LYLCCNAEETFIPPLLIMKGVWQMMNLTDWLPPASTVFMNPK